MALTINQQFTRFVEFASARNDPNNQNTIARLDSIGQGGIKAGRTIKEAEGDAVKKLFRGDNLQRENDMTRKLFRDSIVEIFGGESRIPQSVKDAMKLKDYGQGKPLTVRRIMAVKAAIDACAERANDAFARAKASATESGIYHGMGNVPVVPEVSAKLDRLIATAVNAAMSDPDALELVVAKARGVIERSGDRSLRTEEAIKGRVADILANVAELKEAAKGDPGVLRAGLELLKGMNLKPFKPGVLGTMVRTVMNAGIGSLKALSPNASGSAIHEALEQILENVDKGMVESKVLDSRPDGDEKCTIRAFCIRLQLERLSDAKARGVKELLEAKGELLYMFYGEIYNGELDMGDLDPAIAEYVQRHARNLDLPLQELYAEVQSRTGTQPEQVRQFRGIQNPDYAGLDRGEVSADILERAEAQERKDRQEFLKTMVEGGGRSADKVRRVFDQALPPKVYQPTQQFADTQKKNVRGIINHCYCEARKRLSLNHGDLHTLPFDFDLTSIRNIDVVLPDGSQLARDDSAYDKLAEFVTRGAKSTLAALDDREKNKLAVLLALLSASVGRATETGGMLTLDPHGRDGGKFNCIGPADNHRFDISFDDDQLVVKCMTERRIEGLSIRNAQGQNDEVAVKPGSKLTTDHTIGIPMAELDRMADVDFEAYDYMAVQHRIDDPNVEKPYQNPGNLLGPGFAFGESVSVSTHYKLTIN